MPGARNPPVLRFVDVLGILKSQPPDILVVVLDCVRAAEFESGTDSQAELPFLRSLVPEVISFPFTATVAPWTFPSHASLLTGFYPWELELSSARGGAVSEPFPSIARPLSDSGYRTALLSTNFVVLGNRGRLADGFQEVVSGNWWDFYIRTGETRSLFSDNDPTSRRSRVNGSRRIGVGRGGFLDQFLGELPRTCFHVSQFIQRLKNPTRSLDFRIGPWLEATLDDWLGTLVRSDPTFCLLNLADAHEPYYPDSPFSQGESLFAARGSLPRHGRAAWLTGSWKPSPQELASLRSEYRASLGVLDRRLKSIIDIFKARRKWENTMLVVTSDHGQAFGEHGLVYHSQRVIDSVIRVPLWLRIPGHRDAGTKAIGWASLVDIAPTILEWAGITVPQRNSSTNLTRLIHSPRPTPVFARSEGISPNWVAAADPRIKEDSEGIQVAAYQGEYKVVVRRGGSEIKAYDLRCDPDETTDVLSVNRAVLRPLVSEALRVLYGGRIRALDSEVSETAERLAGWGYI